MSPLDDKILLTIGLEKKCCRHMIEGFVKKWQFKKSNLYKSVHKLVIIKKLQLLLNMNSCSVLRTHHFACALPNWNAGAFDYKMWCDPLWPIYLCFSRCYQLLDTLPNTHIVLLSPPFRRGLTKIDRKCLMYSKGQISG